MLTNNSPSLAARPAANAVTSGPGRRVHHDAPHTAEQFARLADLRDGPARTVLRDELVAL